MNNKVCIKEDFSEYNGEGTILRKAQLRLLEMMVEFDEICKKHNIPYFISGGTCLGAVRHGGFIPWDDDVDIDVMRKDYKRLIKVLRKDLPDKYFLQTPKTDKGDYKLYVRIVDKNSYVTYPETFLLRERMAYKGLFLDIFPLEKVFSYRVKKEIDHYYVAAFRIKRKFIGDRYRRIIAYAIWPITKIFITMARMISLFSDKEKISHAYGTNIIPQLRYSNIFPVKPIFFEGKYLSGPAKPHEYLTELYGDYMSIPSKDKRKVHAEKIEIY